MGKRDSGKQKAIYLTRLCEWIAERSAGALTKRDKLQRAALDRILRRTMIAYVMKGRDTQKKNISRFSLHVLKPAVYDN